MTVISFAAFSGAPGVTTTALATAAALANQVDEVVFVEAATSGGVVGGQYELPLEPGLTSLSLAIGSDRPGILRHAQELPGGLPVVTAPPSGLKTFKLLEARGRQLADYLQTEPAVTLADCGRISVGSAAIPILEASSLVAIVVTPTRENFRLAATALAELQELGQKTIPAGWIIVGSSPWSHDEIVGQYGIPVLSAVPNDRVGAEAIAGLRKLRRHSPLARSVQSFADDLVKHLRIAGTDAPLAYLADADADTDANTDTDNDAGSGKTPDREQPVDSHRTSEGRFAPLDEASGPNPNPAPPTAPDAHRGAPEPPQPPQPPSRKAGEARKQGASVK